MAKVIVTHGSNADCPMVQKGAWKRCHGHKTDDTEQPLNTTTTDLLERIATALEKIAKDGITVWKGES